MKKAGQQIREMVAALGAQSDAARLNMRTQQVRERYRKAIESVYEPRTAQYHLAHTNNVIIRDIDGVKSLVVFVDDSACAADLNAQRELVTLRLLELFGEDIGRFDIRISKWKKYRENHPYVDESSPVSKSEVTPVPLNDEEKSFVSSTVSSISDPRLRKALEKAMTADLEWKKGEKVENDGRSTK